MLYDRLWEIAVGTDWRLISDEYKALAVGGFLVVAVLIWRRTGGLESGNKCKRLKLDLVELRANLVK